MYFTDQELISRQRIVLHNLENFYRQNPEECTTLINDFQCFFHLNRSSDISVRFANATCLNTFELTMKEMDEMGLRFFSEFIELENLEKVRDDLFRFYERANPGKTFAFLQKIRSPKCRTYENYISVTKVDQSRENMITLTVPVQHLLTVNHPLFHEVPGFTHGLPESQISQMELLTAAERNVLLEIGKGKTSQQIGESLGISKLTVDTHRKRIKTKLGVKSLSDLLKIAALLNGHIES